MWFCSATLAVCLCVCVHACVNFLSAWVCAFLPLVYWPFCITWSLCVMRLSFSLCGEDSLVFNTSDTDLW